MIDYISLILFGLVCGYIGYRISDHLHQAVMTDLLHRAGITPDRLLDIMKDLQKEMGEEPVDADRLHDLEIKVEQDGDRMYAYRKDTGLFLAQGKTREELIAMISEKVSGVTLIIAEADGAALIKENPTS